MSEADDDPLIGTTLAGRYRVERQLGQGGMGAVYLAQHIRMHKPVALKVLHPEMGRLSEAVLRFEREAVAAGRVDHEHLVTATDFGELPDGSMYLVLEYVPGKNLATLMADGTLEVVRALKIVRQVAAALAAIHAVGIYHRDVKPDNVMLVDRAGSTDFVKLLDFGMAKLHLDAPPDEPQVTRAGLVFGTPRYMAPEQAAGEPTDHRADLYSLGIVLYAMLTGSPPFSSEEIRDVLRMQRFDPPPPLPPQVDPAVAAFVMTLLAKDPKDRVQTAQGVIEYVDRLMERLTRVKPTSRARVAHFLRTPAGLGTAMALAVLVFAVGLVVARGNRAAAPVAVATSAAAPSPEPSASAAPIGLEAVLVRAEVGDAAAWKVLEARDDKDRSAQEWFVLGVARATHSVVPQALEAYLRAAELDSRYVSHPRVLHDLWVAMRSDSWTPALKVAAALPGPEGSDLLFDLWSSTAKATQSTQRARELLASDVVRARASEAVRVAFDLRAAQGTTCEARRPIIERATRLADTRSLRPLYILAARTGCGRRNRHDCFACLRTSDALDRAVERAKSTPSPDYSRIAAAP